MIYFDNAATTYPKPIEVYDGVNFAMKNYSFNAGRGSYKFSKITFDMIEETREKLASLVLEQKNKVIFTGSATESLNNIIYGLCLSEGDTVFVSPFEHNAVIRTLNNIRVNIELIPFNKETWEINEKMFNDLLYLKRPKAVIISHISNVTGYMLPYEKIFDLSKNINCVNVLDCAQSYGIYNVDKKNIDFIVFAGHKSLYAMPGIAGYINVGDVKLKIYKVGGTGSDSLNLEMPQTLPFRYEAGSYNSIGIYSINCALDFLKSNNFAVIKEELSEYCINQLSNIEGVIIYYPKNKVSHGIVSFNISGYTSDEIGTILSEDYDICVRTGYHCAPYIHDFINSKDYAGTVRISFSGFNTKEEIDCLINAVKELI